jgi:hypothetical protein
VTEDAGLLVSGRAVRAESYLHLQDQQARQARAAGRAPKAGLPRPGSAGRAAGVAVGGPCGGPRPATGAASTRPITRPLARSSRSRLATRWGPSWWVIRPGSPGGTRAGCRTGGCGSGAVPTCSERYATRPSRPGSG